MGRSSHTKEAASAGCRDDAGPKRARARGQRRERCRRAQVPRCVPHNEQGFSPILTTRGAADTLEEVFALKQMLQEFLAEPAPSTSANLPSTTGGQPPPSKRYESRRPVLDESLPPQESSPERPQVRASRKSERLLRQSVHFEPNFQARLRYYMIKNQFNKEQIQAEADEKLHEELKPTPAINQVGDQTECTSSGKDGEIPTHWCGWIR
jgi:hypothetical protein